MLLQSGCEWGYKLGDKAFHELLVTPNPMTLTETKVHDAQFGIRPDGTVTAKAYKLGDAGGLYLEVPPSGRKRWRLKYRFAGKERRLALGLYPNILLGKRGGAVMQPESCWRRGLIRESKPNLPVQPFAMSRRGNLPQQGSLSIAMAACRFVWVSDAWASPRKKPPNCWPSLTQRVA